MYGNLVTAIQSNNIANAYNLLTQITGIPFPGQPKQKMTKTKQQFNNIKDVIFKGKESIFRKYLIGKRLEVSARTVLGPDINLDIDQVGVPITVLKNLTFKEEATVNNLEFLQKLVNNGDKYPGAHRIEISPFYYQKYFNKVVNRNIEILIKGCKLPEMLKLREGYIVHRHILQDDYVIINRQPTLHRQSIVALRVVPHAGFTFMLSPQIVSGLNAD